MNKVGVVAIVTALTLDLDSDDPPPFENEVTSFQVLIGGTAELNVHLLNETASVTTVTTKSDFKLSTVVVMTSLVTLPLLSMADAVWTVSPCRP